MATGISHSQWKTIVDRIHDGQCVPFLGAGANASKEGEYAGPPLGRHVALSLAEEYTGIRADEFAQLVQMHERLQRYPELTEQGFHNLARTALLLETENDTSRLLHIVKDVIGHEGHEPSLLLRALAWLPFDLIVTTNYDNLMEKALDDVDRPYECIVQPAGGFDVAGRREVDEVLQRTDRLVLYKIHGSFASGDGGGGAPPDDVIITEDDYIRFLTVAATESTLVTGVPPLIKEKFAYSTLLFLGYALEDWDFRILFKGLIETLDTRTQRRSWAIQQEPIDIWVKFWGRKDVDICDMDVYDFARELLQRYQESFGR